jgi:hypothetical protein
MGETGHVLIEGLEIAAVHVITDGLEGSSCARAHCGIKGSYCAHAHRSCVHRGVHVLIEG